MAPVSARANGVLAPNSTADPRTAITPRRISSLQEFEASVSQRVDPARDAVERQRKHSRAERLQHDLRRSRVFPRALGLGIPPDRATEVLEEALEPRRIPGSSFVYSTLPPACTSSYGLIAASPTKIELPVGPVLVQDVERARCARCGAGGCRATRGRRRSCGSRSTRGGGTPLFAAEKSSSQTRTCGSIEPPTSRNSSTLTRLRRSGTRCRSSQPAFFAVPSIVPSRSSSSGTPSRAKRRSRRSATLMLRVLSSTSPSRLRKRPLVPDLDRAAVAAAVLPDADAFGVVAVGAERAGAAGADPLRAALRGARAAPRGACLSVSISLSQPPSASTSALSSSRQSALELACAAIPRESRRGCRRSRSTPLKYVAEREVEAVEVRLVLDEARAREHVEIVERQRDDARARAPRAASGTRASRPAACAALRCRKKSTSIGFSRMRVQPPRACAALERCARRLPARLHRRPLAVDDAEHDGVAHRCRPA